MELPGELEHKIDEIRLDNASGALELTFQSAEIYNYFINESALATTTAFMEGLISISNELISSQPAMAPIFNLANNILLGVNETDEIDQMRAGVKNVVDKFTDGLKTNGKKITTNTLDRIQDQTKVMTYSYSSTVFNILVSAHNAGKHFEVICSESRPVCEGTILAKKLADQDIKVTLVVDSTLFSLLPEVDLVVVGADSISTNGLVNKIGTSSLAVAANESDTDFYTLCGSEKFLPKGYPIKLEDHRDPLEVLPEPIENVEVMNIYFDLTPLKYLTGVITEDGAIKVQELSQKLEGLKIHPKLNLENGL